LELSCEVHSSKTKVNRAQGAHGVQVIIRTQLYFCGLNPPPAGAVRERFTLQRASLGGIGLNPFPKRRDQLHFRGGVQLEHQAPCRGIKAVRCC
jgi:hypothetical protein